MSDKPHLISKFKWIPRLSIWYTCPYATKATWWKSQGGPTGPHDHVVIPLLLHRLTFPMSSQQGVSRHRRQSGACGSWAASCLHLFFYIVRAYLESEFTKCSWNGCVNTQHLRGLKVLPSLPPKCKVCQVLQWSFPTFSPLVHKSFHISTKIEKENEEL